MNTLWQVRKELMVEALYPVRITTLYMYMCTKYYKRTDVTSTCTYPRLRLAVMRPCNCDSDSKSKPEEYCNQRKKRLATSTKNSTPLIHSFHRYCICARSHDSFIQAPTCTCVRHHLHICNQL